MDENFYSVILPRAIDVLEYIEDVFCLIFTHVRLYKLFSDFIGKYNKMTIRNLTLFTSSGPLWERTIIRFNSGINNMKTIYNSKCLNYNSVCIHDGYYTKGLPGVIIPITNDIVRIILHNLLNDRYTRDYRKPILLITLPKFLVYDI
jgi:hypothetical protein